MSEWQKLPEGSTLPEGAPVEPGTTVYAFDRRGAWAFQLPELPKERDSDEP